MPRRPRRRRRKPIDLKNLPDVQLDYKSVPPQLAGTKVDNELLLYQEAQVMHWMFVSSDEDDGDSGSNGKERASSVSPRASNGGAARAGSSSSSNGKERASSVSPRASNGGAARAGSSSSSNGNQRHRSDLLSTADWLSGQGHWGSAFDIWSTL